MTPTVMRAVLIAWVLWEGQTVVTAAILPTEWQPVEGLETSAECGEMKTAQHRRLTRMKSVPDRGLTTQHLSQNHRMVSAIREGETWPAKLRSLN